MLEHTEKDINAWRLKNPKWLEGGKYPIKNSTTILRQIVSQLNGKVNFALALQVLQATYPQIKYDMISMYHTKAKSLLLPLVSKLAS